MLQSWDKSATLSRASFAQQVDEFLEKVGDSREQFGTTGPVPDALSRATLFP
jgi:hypothetical protein